MTRRWVGPTDPVTARRFGYPGRWVDEPDEADLSGLLKEVKLLRRLLEQQAAPTRPASRPRRIGLDDVQGSR